MPLHILGPMVVIGIIGIAVALHVLGLSKRLRFDDASARQAWLRHFPDDPVRDVVLAPDRHAALVLSPQGPGVVFSMGADSAAKYLRGAKIEQRGNTLIARLKEFGTPKVVISLPATQQDTWIKLMGPL